MPGSPRTKPPRWFEAVPPLSPAETAVVATLAKGLRNVEIAEELNVSIETIKTHLRHAFRKLGVSNRAGAVAWYLQRTPMERVS